MLTFPEFRRDVAPKELLTRLQAKQHYKEYVMEYNSLSPKLTVSDFAKAAKALNEAKVPAPHWVIYDDVIYDCLKPCGIVTTTTPTQSFTTQYYSDQKSCLGFSKLEGPTLGDILGCKTKQEQGNNPMRAYSDTTSTAAATIINAQSDESKQREYLLEELANATNRSWADQMYPKLREMFNMDAPSIPQTSAEILAAFKDGKFTIDQKKVDANAKYHAGTLDEDDFGYDDNNNYVSSRYYGITFTGLPVADRKGHDEALEAYEKAKKDTKRKIIVGTPAEGLEALLALESWKPETVTVH
jgi:hypothetical protein